MSASLTAISLVTISMTHMSLVLPPSRNAVDKALPLWANGSWWPYSTNCTHKNPYPQTPCIWPGTDGWGCNCYNTSGVCNVAQSCFWFSQGCTIGCKTCDGGGSNPNTKDRCNAGMNSTNNDPKYWTFNVNATPFSAADIYRWNPWRAPGNAPVFDPCGMAGGGPTHQSGEAKYTETKFAKQGDLGTVVLPPAPTGIVWTAGSNVTVKWSIRANHGGGYQYRLCPASQSLTEECFQQTPLPFADNVHLLEYNDSTSETIPGLYLSEGTQPPGSTWSVNPFPYSNADSPPQFSPPCNETVDRTKDDTGRCSGRDPYLTLITDQLTVPNNLAPGKYVLSLRWDCEKSAQIWTNCADLEIN